MTGKKVGIAILNYNASGYLKLTLFSLLKAKTQIPFEVGVIDNGSEPEDAALAKTYFDRFLEKGGQGFFIASPENLGFSGGNNVILRRFLADSEITHLCMLNSDVLVTDHWLEYLTEGDLDVTGPVTNATGNEQTVAVDYEAKLDAEAFELANAFAAYRHETFRDCVFESDVLYFFNTLFSRRVVESVGLLDERFYPGSFEDVDYCLRIKAAGFRQYVVRGCYVHHFGSGSFSHLDMPQRLSISQVNRQRLEEKWGLHWESDTWKTLYSCRQDLSAFARRPLDGRSEALLGKALTATETLVKNWAAGIEWYQSEQYAGQVLAQRQAAPAAQETASTPVEALCGRNLLVLIGKKLQSRFYQLTSKEKYQAMMEQRISFPDCAYPTVPLRCTSGRVMLRRVLRLGLAKLGLTRAPDMAPPPVSPSAPAAPRPAANPAEEARLLALLGKAERRVAVFAPIFKKENERDGYIQRIRCIDESLFTGYFRLYIYEDAWQEQAVIEFVDDEHVFVHYNPKNPAQRALILRWTERCGLMYVHSINRFMPDSVDGEMCQLFRRPDIKTIWDVHGSVPEEYRMYGNELGGRLADETEAMLYRSCDVIVTVNQATVEHLRKKHGETRAEFVVLPILNPAPAAPAPRETAAHERPVVVYAGGTQKWQNVELMQQIMESTAGQYRYKMLVSDIDAFNAGWTLRIPEGVSVDSVAPEEIGRAYAGCDYGFVLRDESVVNRVACPTKILEYVRYGIVPIFKYPQIGDFTALGLRYVDYHCLLDGTLPTEAERQRMAEENLAVLKNMSDIYRGGLRQLEARLADEWDML